MMIITAVFKVFDLIQICLSKLKWASNEAFINLVLNMSKVFFVMSINIKNNFYSFFFVLLINSCKNAAILK